MSESKVHSRHLNSGVSRIATLVLTATLAALSASCVKAESVDIVTTDQIIPDKACGPRCLTALIGLTGVGGRNVTIDEIYSKIGKKPPSVTSLLDLKKAAARFGFIADGYRCSISDLMQIRNFMIIAVGNAKGTGADPLHFVLVSSVNREYATIIDTRTYKPYAMLLTMPTRRAAAS